MKWVTIKKAAELSGYSVRAIEGKRAEGVWLEGEVWRKAPDGRIMISIEGIEKWVEGQASLPQRQARLHPRPRRNRSVARTLND